MICYQKKQLSWSLFGPRINFYLIAHLSPGNASSQSPSVWVSVSVSQRSVFPFFCSSSFPSSLPSLFHLSLANPNDLLISHFPTELPLSPHPLYIALVLALSSLLPTIFCYGQRTCHCLNASCWFIALGRPSSSPGNTGWIQSCCLPSLPGVGQRGNLPSWQQMFLLYKWGNWGVEAN